MTIASTPSSEGDYQPFAPFSSWADQRVGQAWDEFLKTLNEVRQQATPADLEAALDLAMREAAFETSAIEGLYATTRGITRNVALQGAMWEAEVEKVGSNVLAHLEAQLAAFELVLDASTKRLPITEAWLREVHANATAAQPTYQVWTAIGWQDQPLPHGEYKRSANNVTLKDGSTHWYAPVLQTPAEMHRLIEELQTEGFRSAHPVLQAAYAHHALTVIHPFADGNGRVSRALASVFTYRAAGVPLVIFSDQEVPYWDALADADGGDYAPFIRFIEDRVLDTMALVSDRLRQAHEPIERRAQTIRNMFRSHGGLTHGELQALGQRFMQLVGSALRDATGALHLDPDVQTAVGGRSVGDCTYGGLPYHLFTSTIMWTVALSTTEPVALTVQGSFVSGLADATDNPFAFIVIDASDPSTPPLRMRVTDLHPAVSKAAETRMQGWANMIVQLLLGKLESGLRMALKAQGFTTD